MAEPKAKHESTKAPSHSAGIEDCVHCGMPEVHWGVVSASARGKRAGAAKRGRTRRTCIRERTRMGPK